MRKVFVFDLDGALIGSVEMINNCFSHTTQEPGFEPVGKEEFNHFLGDGPKILVGKSLNYLIERDNLDEAKIHSQFNEAHNSYIEYYNRYDDKETQLCPHIRESLDKLKEVGALVCVYTNKTLPVAEKILNNLFPQGHLDYVSVLEDETKRKPNPRLLEKIVEDLNIKKEEIVYFGDTSTDIETCKNAKVTSVNVEWSSREREELVEPGVNFVVSDQRRIVDFYGGLPKNIG